MKKILFSTLATSLLATACLESEDPVGPDCNPITSQVVSTQGDTVTTATGLRYIQLTAGTGATAESCEWAAVRYSGMLASGTQFDQGSFEFFIGGRQLIPGFEEGVLGLQAGGTRRLIVPPNLAYGSTPPAGSGIPANATLIFDIELLAAED